jgi:hypothetical protein
MGRTVCTEPQCLYSRAIPLLSLWAVRPIQSLSACTRVHFTKVYSYVHYNQCLFSILSHINPLQVLPTYIQRVIFDLIIPSSWWSSAWLFPSDILTKIICAQRKLTADILNIQLCTADRGCNPTLGFDMELAAPRHVKLASYEMLLWA